MLKRYTNLKDAVYNLRFIYKGGYFKNIKPSKYLVYRLYNKIISGKVSKIYYGFNPFDPKLIIEGINILPDVYNNANIELLETIINHEDNNGFIFLELVNGEIEVVDLNNPILSMGDLFNPPSVLEEKFNEYKYLLRCLDNTVSKLENVKVCYNDISYLNYITNIFEIHAKIEGIYRYIPKTVLESDTLEYLLYTAKPVGYNGEEFEEPDYISRKNNLNYSDIMDRVNQLLSNYTENK